MSLLALLSPLLLAAGAAAEPPCNSIPGWDEVLTEEVRWIVIGEMHGNNETPALFADAVCLTAQSRPVIVALEQPGMDQPLIDAFLASDGRPDAVAAFLKAAMWNGPMKDGRSSEATLRLFDELRRMHAAGRIAAVVAFLPSNVPQRAGPAGYEEAMAKSIVSAARPDAVTLVLTGNVHAMRTEVPWGDRYLAMAAHLSPAETLTFNTLADGGETWACQPDCGPQPQGKPPVSHPRGVSMTPEVGTPYSGVIHLGAPLTASPPQSATAR